MLQPSRVNANGCNRYMLLAVQLTTRLPSVTTVAGDPTCNSLCRCKQLNEHKCSATTCKHLGLVSLSRDSARTGEHTGAKTQPCASSDSGQHLFTEQNSAAIQSKGRILRYGELLGDEDYLVAW